MKVQTITSPGGIEAWHVEDYSEPMFALCFAFAGGSAQVPPGKEGLTNFLTLMLEQGAGGMTATEYRRRTEDLVIRISFVPGKDMVSARLEVLSDTRCEAADLINLVLTQPRFDAEAMERMRRRMLGFHGEEARDPDSVAYAQWDAVAFPGHPYGEPIYGGEASVSGITADDLRAYCRRFFTKSRLKIAATGDITADELGVLVDRAFGNLPAGNDLQELPIPAPVEGGRLRVAEMDIPQSIVNFGMGSIRYDSPDFIPAWLLTHILGGNSMASRLAIELRGKRGLAHDARAWLELRQHAAVLRGRVGTHNNTVDQTLNAIRDVMQDMADGGLTQTDLVAAKRFVAKSFALGLRSSVQIAGHLLDNAILGFEPDFLERRNEMIAAVTLDELNRVARQMLDPENLIISIAGTPALQPVRRS